MSGMSLEPGGVNCEAVLRDVYVYLDDETDSAARERIRAHLDGCAPCLKQFGLEQDLRALIARCCGSDQAPSTLRERITVRISELSVESYRVEYHAD